jgi:SAM-dependent methyltransferase
MNQNYYDKCAGDYFNVTANIDPTPFLDPITRYFRAGAQVLDVGCGSGRDLLWLKNKGFTATGFELSQNLAALARQHSGCPVIVGDFFHYDFSQISVDVILLTGALVHVPRSQLPEVMERILQALRPEGLLYVSLKEGAGEKQAEDGRTFVLWNDEELRSIFAALNLKVIYFSRQTSRLNSDDTWVGYLLRHHK